MMIDRITVTKPLTKIALAKQQGISVFSLYYKPKKPKQDQLLKNQIEHVLAQHPSYSHRRIAILLKMNKKKIRRVMRLFDIKPYRRRCRRFRKIKDYSLIYPNLLQSIPFPEKANQIWVSLRTKKIRGAKDIWEGRVNQQYRFTFSIRSGVYFLRRVGNHDETLNNP